jgi:hypothetical protein
MLGLILLVVALFLSDSVATLFRLFPLPVLGVVLFFGGMELAASVNSEPSRVDRTVMVVTAGVAIWNSVIKSANRGLQSAPPDAAAPSTAASGRSV